MSLLHELNHQMEDGHINLKEKLLMTVVDPSGVDIHTHPSIPTSPISNSNSPSTTSIPTTTIPPMTPTLKAVSVSCHSTPSFPPSPRPPMAQTPLRTTTAIEARTDEHLLRSPPARMYHEHPTMTTAVDMDTSGTSDPTAVRNLKRGYSLFAADQPPQQPTNDEEDDLSDFRLTKRPSIVDRQPFFASHVLNHNHTYSSDSTVTNMSDSTATTNCCDSTTTTPSSLTCHITSQPQYVHLLCPDPRAFADVRELPQKAPTRFQLKCPPTPSPRMCISVSGSDLFSNKILLPVPNAGHSDESKQPPLSDSSDEEDLEDDDGDISAIDIHALSSFTNGPTYTSSNPFAHSTAQNPSGSFGQGPFIFELDFCDHKLVGSGSFFEVFRCEKRSRAATWTEYSNVKLQQAEFQQFSLELSAIQHDTTKRHRRSSEGAVQPYQSTTNHSTKKVFAIKKSLKPFRSEFERDSYLRESKMLDYINRAKISPPIVNKSTLSPHSSSLPSTALVPHRNPHIVRSFSTWTENGYFFERLEYCLCNLNEFIYIMMETPDIDQKRPITPTITTTTTPPATTPPTSNKQKLCIQIDNTATTYISPIGPSYFHTHMLRMFLSIATQITLALYTLHSHGIVHLDIKPDNILLNRRSSRLLLSDFGFAQRLEEIHAETDSNGPDPNGWIRRHENEEVVYMAPELLNNSSMVEEEGDLDLEEEEEKDGGRSASSFSVTDKVDQFSLGLLLFELLSNCELPKNGVLWRRLRQGFVSEYLPTADNDTPGITWMGMIITNLLDPAPQNRMSSSELLLAIELKLRELEWIDTPISTDSTDIHVQQLVYDWTTALPSKLALPSLHQLNYQSLIDRAHEQNPQCPTPTPIATPRASPCPLWPGPTRSATIGASPRLRRQLSSPSPSSLRQQQPPQGSPNGRRQRVNQFNNMVTPPPYPDSKPSTTFTPSAAARTLKEKAGRPAHHRSASVGVLTGLESSDLDESHLTPTHALTVDANACTPSLRNRQRLVPHGSPPRHTQTMAPNPILVPKVRTNLPQQPPTGPSPFPLSPFKLNSPARRPSWVNGNTFVFDAPKVSSTTVAAGAVAAQPKEPTFEYPSPRTSHLEPSPPQPTRTFFGSSLHAPARNFGLSGGSIFSTLIPTTANLPPFSPQHQTPQATMKSSTGSMFGTATTGGTRSGLQPPKSSTLLHLLAPELPDP